MEFNLLPALQSGFRACHSTETAVLKVLSDILTAVDQGNFSALVLLDISAAFDTVDHYILLQRLEQTFGITGSVLQWFHSYLQDRCQFVRCGVEESSRMTLECGVPQGSVLGPLLFIIYTADLCQVIQQHGFRPHLYADDTQIYGSCDPNDVDSFSRRLAKCIDVVFDWMKSNRLLPNPDKTELLWNTTRRRQHLLPTDDLQLSGVSVTPSRAVRNLGIFMDSALTMQEHVTRTVSRCFGALRQLRSIRQLVPSSVFQSLVTALVMSRLDYGNVALSGLTSDNIQRLQSVQNAAARLIFGLRRSDHVTSALLELHWLKVPQRINHKLLTLTYRALNGLSPSYLNVFARCSSHQGRLSLRSSSAERLLVPSYKLVSAGSRTFSVSGAMLWNSLPHDIATAPSLTVFRKRLKTFLFQKSFPDYMISV